MGQDWVGSIELTVGTIICWKFLTDKLRAVGTHVWLSPQIGDWEGTILGLKIALVAHQIHPILSLSALDSKAKAENITVTFRRSNKIQRVNLIIWKGGVDKIQIERVTALVLQLLSSQNAFRVENRTKGRRIGLKTVIGPNGKGFQLNCSVEGRSKDWSYLWLIVNNDYWALSVDLCQWFCFDFCGRHGSCDRWF